MSFAQATFCRNAPNWQRPFALKYGDRGAAPQPLPAQRLSVVQRAPNESAGNRQILLLHGANHYIITANSKTDSSTAMNASNEMSFDEMLRVRLEVMRREHRDLDEAIFVLETAGRPDPLTLRRLKKQKLALKDQIVKIEDTLIPDIIA
jgi:hypothetical protein